MQIRVSLTIVLGTLSEEFRYEYEIEYENNFSIGYFQVILCLCFKTRLPGKPFI